MPKVKVMVRMLQEYSDIAANIPIKEEDGYPPSDLSELLCCPFCEGKATRIPKEDSPGYLPEITYITCRNAKCELTDWIPYDDWQRRAT